MVMGRVCGLVIRQKAGSAGLPPFMAELELDSACARGHIDRVRAFQGRGDCQEAGKYVGLSHEQRDQAQNGLQRFEPRPKADVFDSRHAKAKCLKHASCAAADQVHGKPFPGISDIT